MSDMRINGTGAENYASKKVPNEHPPVEELSLNSVLVTNKQNNTHTVLVDETGNTNYYRANSVFGDIATKKSEYPEQNLLPSKLKEMTQATKEVEDVTIDVASTFSSDTARDLQAFDIAAKPAGVGGFSQMKDSDAYKMFLQVNSDDFTVRQTEYNGKVESKEYFDKAKSDGKISVFSSEIIDGKEYLAIRDKAGQIHYYDPQNKLSEVKIWKF